MIPYIPLCVCMWKHVQQKKKRNPVVRDEQRYLQISVGMATKSNSSQYFKFFSTMLMSAERKCKGRLSVSFRAGLHSPPTLRRLRKSPVLTHAACNSAVASLCLFLVLFPSSSSSSIVASSNQDIMRAKRGCISTLRAAGFSEPKLRVVRKNSEREKKREERGRGGDSVSGLKIRRLYAETVLLWPASLSHHALKQPCVLH